MGLAIMPIGLTNGPGPAIANVFITLEGTVAISVGVTEMGQGVRTIFTQLASEVLGVKEGEVTVSHCDSSLVPHSAGPGASQETYMTGNALLRALKEVEGKVRRLAADKMGVAEDLLFFEGGRVCAEGNKHSMTLQELAAAATLKGDVLTAAGMYKPDIKRLDEKGLGVPYEEYGYAGSIAEVLVDTETGQVSVDGLVVALDAGRAFNPILVEGQVEGGAIMNLGFALMEDLYPNYPQVKHLASNLNEYLVPTSLDVPEIKTIIVEKPSVKGPLGAKGIGEITAAMIAPAIVNAIAEAVGVSADRLPVTSERLFELLQNRVVVRKEVGRHDR